MSFFVYGRQTGIQQSSTGLTNVLYNISIPSELLLVIFLLIIPLILFAFLLTLLQFILGYLYSSHEVGIKNTPTRRPHKQGPSRSFSRSPNVSHFFIKPALKSIYINRRNHVIWQVVP